MRVFPQLKAIAAVSLNGVLGVENRIPWHIPEELAFFKSITRGQAILMGRRTFESLGRLLPHRQHWVLSRDRAFLKSLPPVVRGFADPEKIFQYLDTLPESQVVWVIGGETIYKLFLPHCNELILSRIQQTFAGDRHWQGEDGFSPQEILCRHPRFISQRWVRANPIQN